MADPVLIPTFPDEPFYSQVTDLDGRSYVLEFQHELRFDRWRLTINDGEGNALLDGIVLVPGVDLLKPYVYLDTLPPGLLQVVTTGDDDTAPGLGELGSGRRCELVYTPVTA